MTKCTLSLVTSTSSPNFMLKLRSLPRARMRTKIMTAASIAGNICHMISSLISSFGPLEFLKKVSSLTMSKTKIRTGKAMKSHLIVRYFLAYLRSMIASSLHTVSPTSTSWSSLLRLVVYTWFGVLVPNRETRGESCESLYDVV